MLAMFVVVFARFNFGNHCCDRDYKISWNLEHYLTELEVAVEKVLAENTRQKRQK